MTRFPRENIWELPGWPRFTWDADRLAPSLDLARGAQSELLGTVKALGGTTTEAAVDSMAREVVSNSAIEGVTLELEAVRASMMLRLGATASVAGATGRTRRVDLERFLPEAW